MGLAVFLLYRDVFETDDGGGGGKGEEELPGSWSLRRLGCPSEEGGRLLCER